jgi:uncharacterized OB-fold protein
VSLRADHALHLPFTRSVGGATASFLEGLARREVLGSREADGVVVPPVEGGGELVRVGDAGIVVAWCEDAGVTAALIRLDGADSHLLHVLDVVAPTVGMRVHADWRPERTGSITDVRAFVAHPPASGHGEPVTDGPTVTRTVESRIDIAYDFEPGETLSRFFTALAEGRIEGGRCTRCSAVYVPPRPGCPRCGGAPMNPVEASERGTVVSSTVVHLSVPRMEVPFAWGWIRLDGTDVPFAHLLEGLDVGVGDAVEAVWADGRSASWEAIRHFRRVR